MLRSCQLATLVILVCISALAAASNESDPVAAYSNGNELVIVARSGAPIRTVKTPFQIQSFAISPNLQFAALVRATGQKHGGPLYLLNLRTGKMSRATHGRHYFKKFRRCEHEVYADPEFSPDGRHLVFAIRFESQDDGNDVVAASGPLAQMDVRTGKVAILRATADVDEGGPAYANTPRFSPEGDRLLVSFESGAAVIEGQEARLRNLSAAADDGVFAAIGWLGNQCVVYVSGRDWSDANGKPARVYNLQTKESISLAKLFGIPEETTVGLMDIAGSAWTRREEGGQTKLYVVGEDERLLVNRKGVRTRGLRRARPS